MTNDFKTGLCCLRTNYFYFSVPLATRFQELFLGEICFVYKRCNSKSIAFVRLIFFTKHEGRTPSILDYNFQLIATRILKSGISFQSLSLKNVFKIEPLLSQTNFFHHDHGAAQFRSLILFDCSFFTKPNDGHRPYFRHAHLPKNFEFLDYVSQIPSALQYILFLKFL